MNQVLLIAFHYPPCKGSSGVQRTLSLTKYLPQLGWQPIVLTAGKVAYPSISDDQMGDIPENVLVRRSLALDTARHLSIGGKYLAPLAWPDRWISWWVAGVIDGLRLIRKNRPTAIWSTYPIATAHLIGLTLHRLTGIPWIADFRDSMSEDEYPPDPKLRRLYRWIEKRTLEYSTGAVFTAPGTIRMYKERYPDYRSTNWVCIPNGYDEESFQVAEFLVNRDGRIKDKVTLVHSGLIYPTERDPRVFFSALKELKTRKLISQENLEVKLRASGHDEYIQHLIDDKGIQDIVQLCAPIGYKEALSEMLNADGLLILQGSNCNHQIPAKVYEYLRAKRPIIALADQRGDTAALLRNCGIDAIAGLDKKEEIEKVMETFIDHTRRGVAAVPNDDVVEAFSRRSRAKELAQLLETVTYRLQMNNATSPPMF